MLSLLATNTPLGAGLRVPLARVHKHAANVAPASKLAQIVWAALRRGEALDTTEARDGVAVSLTALA